MKPKIKKKAVRRIKPKFVPVPVSLATRISIWFEDVLIKYLSVVPNFVQARPPALLKKRKRKKK